MCWSIPYPICTRYLFCASAEFPLHFFCWFIYVKLLRRQQIRLRWRLHRDPRMVADLLPLPAYRKAWYLVPVHSSTFVPSDLPNKLHFGLNNLPDTDEHPPKYRHCVVSDRSRSVTTGQVLRTRTMQAETMKAVVVMVAARGGRTRGVDRRPRRLRTQSFSPSSAPSFR